MRSTALLALAAICCGAVALGAQAPAQPRIWQGVYTTAQADRGRATYATTCLRCHNPDLSGDRGPALKGERFMTSWGGGSVTRLFEKIRDTMPPFATSTLDDQAKLDVVAFILQTNGFPAAERQLALSELDGIQILAQGEQPKAQNFARVAVFGCLARGDANRFVLTSASEPAVAADNAAAPIPPPGTSRVVLLNAAQFSAEAQIGRRVEARGLVYRDDRDMLLAVSALKAIGPCGN